MSETAADWSPGESIRIEALQVQHAQLREKLNAARWQLSACTRARDTTSSEHAAAAEEATQLESRASVVRQEVIACGDQLRALNAADGTNIAQSQESGVTRAFENPFPLAQSLHDKKHVLECSIRQFEEEAYSLRSHSKHECTMARSEESELEYEANMENEHMLNHIRRCEKETSACEMTQHELQLEYAQRGDAQRVELDAAELDTWREVLGAQKYEQQEESHLEQIALERNRLQLILEESRLSAADATCVRARLRRVMRDVEVRSAACSAEMQTAQRVFKVLAEERNAVEKRLGNAEIELAGMLANMLTEEKRWDAEMDQVCEHRKMLEARVRRGVQKEEFLRDTVLKEEFEELQHARFHLSQVEARSCVAEQSLSEALSRLASSQETTYGTHALAELLPSYSSSQIPRDDIRDLLDKTQRAMHTTQDRVGLWNAPSATLAAPLTPKMATATLGTAVSRRPLAAALQMPQNV